MPYSAKSTGVPLNELVSITSQPTSRKPACTFSTASGRVTRRFSLQPSKRGPPKSSRERFWTWRLVPMAPSKTTMRSLIVSRRFGISNNKGPALNNAEPQELNSSSCLADYFKWPQVALTHHLKLSNRIEPHLASPVNPRKIEVVSIRFLCATSVSSVSVVSLLASTHHREHRGCTEKKLKLRHQHPQGARITKAVVRSA